MCHTRLLGTCHRMGADKLCLAQRYALGGSANAALRAAYICNECIGIEMCRDPFKERDDGLNRGANDDELAAPAGFFGRFCDLIAPALREAIRSGFRASRPAVHSLRKTTLAHGDSNGCAEKARPNDGDLVEHLILLRFLYLPKRCRQHEAK